MKVVLDHLPDVLSALWTTVQLAVLSFLGALVVGTVVAILRISPVAPLRAAGLAYVEFFRNIPLLSLLFLVVFGLPDLDVTFSLFISAVIGMSLFSGAFVCESIRTGINTVPLGQAEAARAIGLTFTQSLRRVILPQAFRSMIQPLVNVWIGTLIGTSLAAAVGVYELTAQGQILQLQYAGGLPVFASIAVLYIAMALLSGGAGSWLERKVAIRR
jgi:glutamate transport system permease protein